MAGESISGLPETLNLTPLVAKDVGIIHKVFHVRVQNVTSSPHHVGQKCRPTSLVSALLALGSSKPLQLPQG